MPEGPRSSFIPKQAPKLGTPQVRKRTRQFNLFTFIGTTILIGSLILAGGTFFYHDQVNKQLVEAKNTLAEERQRFNEGDIALVREIDRRIKAAQYRLDNHIVTSKIFDALELDTNKRIQFRNLSMLRDTEGALLVELGGVTETFASVALQEISFGNNDVLETASVDRVSNDVSVIDPEALPTEPDDPRDDVEFEISMKLPQSALLYTGRVAGASDDLRNLELNDVTTDTVDPGDDPDLDSLSEEIDVDSQ